MPPDLAAAGRATLTSFDVRDRAFHLEFFRLPAGELVGLEVNMRPPGGLTVDMFDLANDIDFHRAWARMLVHGTCDLELSRPYDCLYVGRKRHRSYAMPHDQVLSRFGGLIVHHQPMEEIFGPAMGHYGYLLRHADLDPLLDARARMQAVT